MIFFLRSGLDPYFPTDFQSGSFKTYELLLFGLMSCFLGLFGVLFVKALEKVRQVRRTYKVFARSKYIQVIIITLFSAGLAYPFLPLRNAYGKIFHYLFSEAPLGENLMFLILPSEFVARFILTCNLKKKKKSFTLISKHFFQVVTLGLPIPSGVMGPLLITGALFGRLFGELLNAIFPNFGKKFKFSKGKTSQLTVKQRI